MDPKISIIIRTFNEERWISHCLQSIFSQNYKNIEVIIVDNNSTDNTLPIAMRHSVKVISINDFFPGKAINDGIKASSGEYIVCISAHCIPTNTHWLESLYLNLKDKLVAGVYGRQLPLPYTSDADKRDLLITFGRDKKIQYKDIFFHNANSMFARSVWEKFPFDEKATNIEDRIWGKAVIEAGYRIVYEPEASVFHYHGLHQHKESSVRARGIAKILDSTDIESQDSLPDTLMPLNIAVASVILLNKPLKDNTPEKSSFLKLISDLQKARYVDRIYILCERSNLVEIEGIYWIDRGLDIFQNPNLDFVNLLNLSLMQIESSKFYPEVILYVNHNYLSRPRKLFDNLIHELQFKGLSSVFTGFEDYGHYWQKQENGSFEKIVSSMSSRESREPIFRALYGLGCATISSEIRKNSLTGNDIGIMPITDYRHTLNLREAGTREILENEFDER